MKDEAAYQHKPGNIKEKIFIKDNSMQYKKHCKMFIRLTPEDCKIDYLDLEVTK